MSTIIRYYDAYFNGKAAALPASQNLNSPGVKLIAHVINFWSHSPISRPP